MTTAKKRPAKAPKKKRAAEKPSSATSRAKKKSGARAPSKKKKPTAAKTAPTRRKSRPAAVTQEGTHKLTRPQLQKWRMLEAEARAAEAHLALAKMLFSGYMDKFPEVRGAYTNFTSATKVFDTALGEVRSYVMEFCDRMGLDPNKIAINDESGGVTELDDPAKKT